MSTNFSNEDNVIDSREIIERIEELSDERDSFLEEDETKLLPEWDKTPEAEELKSLLALQEECEGYSDWEYGITLIRCNYFKEYAEDLAKDVGDLPDNIPAYIYDNINWQGVADDLSSDYTKVDFDGIEYYFR